MNLVKASAIRSELIYLQKDMRAKSMEPAAVFKSIPSKSREVVCLDLSCVKSDFAEGVGVPCSAMGLTNTEVCDIAYEAGQSTRIFSISEYNPAVEKFSTGSLLNNML